MAWCLWKSFHKCTESKVRRPVLTGCVTVRRQTPFEIEQPQDQVEVAPVAGIIVVGMPFVGSVSAEEPFKAFPQVERFWFRGGFAQGSLISI